MFFLTILQCLFPCVDNSLCENLIYAPIYFIFQNGVFILEVVTHTH